MPSKGLRARDHHRRPRHSASIREIPHAAEPAPSQEPWYKCGVILPCLEMRVAVGVCADALCMTFHGRGGFPGGKRTG